MVRLESLWSARISIFAPGKKRRGLNELELAAERHLGRCSPDILFDFALFDIHAGNNGLSSFSWNDPRGKMSVGPVCADIDEGLWAEARDVNL